VPAPAKTCATVKAIDCWSAARPLAPSRTTVWSVSPSAASVHVTVAAAPLFFTHSLAAKM
jgi:hypothetical protein